MYADEKRRTEEIFNVFCVYLFVFCFYLIILFMFCSFFFQLCPSDDVMLYKQFSRWET